MATKKTHNKAAKKKTTIGRSPITKLINPVRNAAPVLMPCSSLPDWASNLSRFNPATVTITTAIAKSTSPAKMNGRLAGST